MWKIKKPKLLLLVLFAAVSYPLLSQDFSSIDMDLEQLENLIADTLKNSEAQLKQLEDLIPLFYENEKLIESYGNIITEREKSLRDLQERLNGMSETYRRQSALSGRYAKRLKFWRVFTAVAVPAAAGLGVWAGVSIAR